MRAKVLVPRTERVCIYTSGYVQNIILATTRVGTTSQFSFIVMGRRGLLGKGLRSVAVRNIASILGGLRRGPGTILLFAIYLRRFLKYSLRQICRRLRREFPGVAFVHYCVSPVVRGRKPAPSRGLEGTVCRPLPGQGTSRGTIDFLNDSFMLRGGTSLGQVIQTRRKVFQRLPKYGD